jgi:hypothetical protein
MKFNELTQVGANLPTGDLNLRDFIPEIMDDPTEAPKLASALDVADNEHIVSIKNLKEATSEGVAVEEEDGSVTLKHDTWSVLNGVTVSNLGRGFDLGKRKFGKR